MVLFKSNANARLNNPTWLSLLRIGVALVLITKILAELPHIYIIYSSQGIIQGVINEKIFTPYTPTLHFLFKGISFVYDIPEPIFIKSFFVLYLMLAVALLIGWQTRVVAILCWLFHVCLFNNSPLVSYGVDSFLLSLLFYCCIFPTHLTWSVDCYLRNCNYDTNRLPLYQFFLQLHLAVIYLVAGIAKLQGITWLKGIAIWHAISQPQFQSSFSAPLMNFAANFPIIIYILTWSTLFSEIGYGIFIWFKKIRVLFFLAIIMMHLFIAFVMHLQLFSFTMIVFNVAAFGTFIYNDLIKMVPSFKRNIILPSSTESSS